jgi:glycosyltransferase involved in cell wall biosynthesis
MKNKKLNIVIAYQYLSFKGGIEEVILNQSKYLKQKGHNVEILTSQYGKDEAGRTKDGIVVHRIPSINITYKLFGIPFAIPTPTFANYKKIARIIKNADVINIHGHPYLTSFLHMIISKKFKKPVILTQHNTNIQSKSKIINTVYFFFDQTLGKFNLNNSKKVIAVSKETKKYIQTLMDKDENIEVIYNGVDLDRFNVKYNKSKLRTKFKIPTDKFVCLTIRRLTFKNGIENFLNIAKLCDQKKTLFLLGGTGPDAEKIKNYIQQNEIKNIKLLGFVKDEDLAQYYALSDVFILPSINGEGFPMVVLESFSSGVPVLATRSGGHIEVIKKDKTGYLVDTNKSHEMSEKIDHLIKNEKLLKALSKTCRELVETKLSWKQNITQFENLIHSVA